MRIFLNGRRHVCATRAVRNLPPSTQGSLSSPWGADTHGDVCAAPELKSSAQAPCSRAANLQAA